MTDPLKILRLLAAEFSEVDDETVQTWIDLTVPLVSRKKFGNVYEQALALLTAHRMYIAGVGEKSDDMTLNLGNIAAGKIRHISSYSEGNVSVSFNHEQGDLNTDSDAYYGLSKYGVDFLNLRDKHIMPITSSGW